MANIYKDKKRNSWYIHTKVKINDKWQTCTIRGFKTLGEAKVSYDSAIEKWKREHSQLSTCKTFTSIVENYYTYREKIVRKESLRKDKTQLDGYFKPLFQYDTLDNIFTSYRLEQTYNAILNNNELNSQKKMRLVLAFRDFSKYCYLAQHINQSAYDMVNFVFLPVKEDRQDRKSKRYIPKTHFKTLLSHINKVNDNLFACLISVAYLGGLRISELLGLLKEDVDLEKRIIKVRRQLLTNGNLTTTLKTSNSYRNVPINSELYDLFKKFELMNDRLFPISHTTAKRKLAIYEKEAGIPNYSFHEYRESFCTNLAMNISNVSEISFCARVSGHTTQMFLNTYVKSLDDELNNKFFK